MTEIAATSARTDQEPLALRLSDQGQPLAGVGTDAGALFRPRDRRPGVPVSRRTHRGPELALRLGLPVQAISSALEVVVIAARSFQLRAAREGVDIEQIARVFD